MTTSVSGVLGNKGAKLKLVHEGRTYPVGHLTQQAKAAFEAWLKQEAIAPVVALKPGRGKESPLSAAEWRELWSDTLAAVAGGNFAWFGPHAMEAIQTERGMLALAGILFELGPDEMRGLVEACPEQVSALLDLVISESAPQREPGGEGDGGDGGEGGDPNAQAPAKAG